MLTISPELKERMSSRAISTLKAKKDEWLENAKANAGRVIYQVGKLWRDSNHKTGVLIAAGPSLEKSIEEIKALDRKQHEIVCVDMALKFILSRGIIPDYVICGDSSAAIADSLKVPEYLSLLLNVIAHPDTAKDWKGPIYWFTMMSNVLDKSIGEWMQTAHAKASGVHSFLVPGGNVASLGLSFLLSVRAVPKVLLYGHDFCWADESRFYCGGVSADLAKARLESEKASGTIVAMKDSLGRDVYTNASLLYFVSWYEDILKQFPGVIENRTPSSILTQGGIA